MQEEEQDYKNTASENDPRASGRMMGIDYGSKKVGVAVSNSEGTIAFPKEILENKELEKTAEKIKTLAEELEVSGIVVGFSVDEKGKENPIMNEIRAFVNKFKERSGIPIYFEPEDMTTAEASLARKKGNVDDSAAALILQGFLERSQ